MSLTRQRIGALVAATIVVAAATILFMLLRAGEGGGLEGPLASEPALRRGSADHPEAGPP